MTHLPGPVKSRPPVILECEVPADLKHATGGDLRAIEHTFARLIEVKQLGFSLPAAVLIDMTRIRINLVPAAMQRLGRWNWWFPPWLDQRLPRIDLSERAADGVAADDAASTARGNRSVSGHSHWKLAVNEPGAEVVHAWGSGDGSPP